MTEQRVTCVNCKLVIVKDTEPTPEAPNGYDFWRCWRDVLRGSITCGGEATGAPWTIEIGWPVTTYSLHDPEQGWFVSTHSEYGSSGEMVVADNGWRVRSRVEATTLARALNKAFQDARIEYFAQAFPLGWHTDLDEDGGWGTLVTDYVRTLRRDLDDDDDD